MSQKKGAKGQNLCAKPRKRPSKSEIAKHITVVKRQLVFQPFGRKFIEEYESQEVRT